MADNPLLKKLRIIGGQRLAMVNSPLGYRATLGELPESTLVAESLDGVFDIVHGFYVWKADLEAQLEALKAAMAPGAILWVSYPKGSAKKETDLNRDIIANFLLARGLKPVAQVSIDEVWSAIRFKKLD